MSIPSTYTHADKLGADGRAALAGARLVWDGLTARQREALVESFTCRYHGPCLGHVSNLPTRRALARRGLARDTGDGRQRWAISPLGLLVREAGTRIPTSAGEL